MTKKQFNSLCVSTKQAATLITNAYVVAVKDGCLPFAMIKPATHVEPISSGLSIHMHWVCDILICPVSHAHTQGYDHLTYPL